MHKIQQKITSILKSKNNHDLTLRRIAEIIDEDTSQPQKIKHHLHRLEQRGILRFDQSEKKLFKIDIRAFNADIFISIPILGAANCGEATLFAEGNLEGYLKLTRSVLNREQIKGLFAIKAVGNSMNMANIDGKNIDDGDYLIVDSSRNIPQNNEYVVSIIDGQANVKKFKYDKENSQIVLISESSLELPPIFIHPDDLKDYRIAGKVIQVVKKPKW